MLEIIVAGAAITHMAMVVTCTLVDNHACCSTDHHGLCTYVRDTAKGCAYNSSCCATNDHERECFMWFY